MCGRFVISSPPEAIRQAFGYAEQPNFPPRYNIAPTQPVPVVMLENGSRHFRLMRWGLLPSWVKDPRKFSLVINARGETVLEKPAFKAAMKRRRCLLPADGYYEWQALSGRKQPFFIHHRNRQPLALAGLVETWVGPDGEEIDTVAIVTTASRDEMTHLHHRVPVVIAPQDFSRWLDGNAFGAEEAAALLIAPPEGMLVWHEVTPAVNRVANDDPQLILPISAEEAAAIADTFAQKKPLRKTSVPKKDMQPDDGQGSLF